MKLLENILSYNEMFVEEKQYEEYITTKYPNKRMVILTCMDTRLGDMLPKAMNVNNGDVKIIKNAGALVSHPFGSIMRSILVAVYELQADEVFVIGHHDCGMGGLKPDIMIEHMKERGVTDETLETLQYSGFNVYKWLKGFKDVSERVANSVEVIRNHPLFPQDAPVHGLVIDPETGKLELVVDGYETL